MAGTARLGPTRTSLLADELRSLRQLGLTRVADGRFSSLFEAATQLGYTDADLPVGEVLRRLVEAAIGRMAAGGDTLAVAQVFGVAPGTRMWVAADRRKAAARTQGVSVERFRRGYEPQLIRLVADEISTMLGEARTPEPPPPRGSSLREVLVDGMHLAEPLAAAHAHADWRPVRGLYRQCLALAGEQAVTALPVMLSGALSTELERLAPCYAGAEQEFALHLVAVLLDADRRDRITFALLDALYDDPRIRRFPAFTAGRGGLPTPLETCVETVRRIRDIEAVRTALADALTSGIVGGSSSYGRFYHVRGGRDAGAGSDLDLILVLADFGQFVQVVNRLATLPALAATDLERLEHRARLFSDAGLDDGRTVFSQKLAVWSGIVDPVVPWRDPETASYTLDLRVASVEVLEWLVLAGLPRIEADVAGNWRGIRDYCESSPYEEDNQRDFSGRNNKFVVDVTETAGGVLRTSRAYYIDDSDRFYPGTMQNLVLPLTDCRWDGLAVRPLLDAFQAKIEGRLQHERAANPYERLSRVLAHARSASFAPAVCRLLER